MTSEEIKINKLLPVQPLFPTPTSSSIPPPTN